MPSRVWTFGSRRGRFLLAAASAATVTMLSVGCSTSATGSTPSARAGTGDSGVAAQAEPFQKLGYRLTWSIGDVGGEQNRTKMIDIGDDLLLVHDISNNLSAREMSNGESRWAVNLGNPLNKFLGNLRIGERIVATAESELLILDASTGRLDDRQRLAVLSNTAPALADGYMLIFGTARGEVFGHDVRIGLKRWGFALNQQINGKPVLIGSIAGAVAQSGQVLLVNPTNGEAIAPLRQIYGGLDNNPVSDGVNMYVASTDQSIYAFGATTGELLWRVRTQARLRAQPAVHDGALYQYVPGEGMLSIDTRSGERNWTSADIDGSVIAVREGNLVVWNGTQAMLVDPASGELLERVDLPGVRMLVANGFVDGDLIAVSGRSSLARYISR